MDLGWAVNLTTASFLKDRKGEDRETWTHEDGGGDVCRDKPRNIKGLAATTRSKERGMILVFPSGSSGFWQVRTGDGAKEEALEKVLCWGKKKILEF